MVLHYLLIQNYYAWLTSVQVVISYVRDLILMELYHSWTSLAILESRCESVIDICHWSDITVNLLLDSKLEKENIVAPENICLFTTKLRILRGLSHETTCYCSHRLKTKLGVFLLPSPQKWASTLFEGQTLWHCGCFFFSAQIPSLSERFYLGSSRNTLFLLGDMIW